MVVVAVVVLLVDVVVGGGCFAVFVCGCWFRLPSLWIVGCRG